MEWKLFIGDVRWEHQGPTGSAGTTVIALELHWRCTGSLGAYTGIVLRQLQPKLALSWEHWSCTGNTGAPNGNTGAHTGILLYL